MQMCMHKLCTSSVLFTSKILAIEYVAAFIYLAASILLLTHSVYIGVTFMYVQ